MARAKKPLTMSQREFNRKREQRRRAVAKRMYSGLRAHGNFNLPKHCDNNEVLKAFARAAGWVVEDDGTTYPKDWKHGTPCPNNPDRCTTCKPAAGSSSTQHSTTIAGNPNADPNSLIPGLKNFSSGSSSSGTSPAKVQQMHMQDGSKSVPIAFAPVTTILFDQAGLGNLSDNAAAGVREYTFMLPSPSVAPIPAAHPVVVAERDRFPIAKASIPQGGGGVGTSSPTFISLMSLNPISFAKKHAPVPAARIRTNSSFAADAPMAKAGSGEYAFERAKKSRSKLWNGENVNSEADLTLGSSKTRGKAPA